jgi:hypothetical protein
MSATSTLKHCCERRIVVLIHSEKVDNISEVQATEYKTDMADRHVSVVEVTGVLGVTVMFKKLVIAALYELQDGKGKYRGLFSLKHLKPYLENTNKEEGSTTTQAEKGIRRQQESQLY